MRMQVNRIQAHYLLEVSKALKAVNPASAQSLQNAVTKAMLGKASSADLGIILRATQAKKELSK